MLTRRFSRFIPYLLVSLIAIPAMWPFLVNPSLPAATDAELHIFRLAELSRLLRAGAIYPRWSPNFYFGYGYPIFNYYAPFSYYVGFLFDILPGIDPVGATKAVFLLGLLLGGWGTFGYVRLLWGDRAGYIAAALFLYAPYIQYIDPHARGVLAESLSLGLFPVVIWRFEQLRRERNRFNFVTAALALSAMVLSHNLMAMIGSGILLVWIVWELSTTGPQSEEDGSAAAPRVATLSVSGWPLVTAFGIGLLLAMFFWLPVGLERNAVNLDTLVGEEGSHFAFSNHFLSWGELLSPSLRPDWGATEPAYRFNIGLVQSVLTLLAIVLWITNRLFGRYGSAIYREDKKETSQFLFWLLALGGLLFLLFPISTFVWRSVPVMPFIQFPWRLLGPIAFLVAVLGGYVVRSRPAVWLVVPPLLLLAMPLVQVRPWEPFGPTDIAAVAFQETRGRWLGTTSTADFLPATVEVIPNPEPLVMDVLRQNGVPERINRYTVPDDATIEFEPAGPLHFRYRIETPKPFQFRLYLFQFPGWTISLNHVEIEPDLGRPEGFIVVPLEAGTHVVEARFGSTPARRLGWGLSFLGLASLAAIALIGFAPAQALPRSRNTSLSLMSGAEIAVSILLLFSLFSVFNDVWRFESRPGEAVVASNRLAVNFGDQILLLGGDVAGQFGPGEVVDVTLYWQAQGELDIDYQVFVHLLKLDGSIVAQSDKLNPGDFPTGRWPTERYVRDPHQISLPDTLPQGAYRLTVGLWVQDEGWRLPVFDEAGQRRGDVYELRRYLE